MSKYKARLKDISSLEFAESKAKSRLTHIRKSMVRSDCCQLSDNGLQPVARLLTHNAEDVFMNDP